MRACVYFVICLLFVAICFHMPSHSEAAVLADADENPDHKKVADQTAALSVRRSLKQSANEKTDDELLNTYISINETQEHLRTSNTHRKRLAQIMRRATTLEASSPDTLTEFAEDYLEIGEPELAAASAWIAARKDPENPERLFLLACALEECKDYKNARTVFEWVYSLNSSMVVVESHLGNIDFETQQFESAERHYQRALDSGVDSALIRQRLRDVRVMLNRPEVLDP